MSGASPAGSAPAGALSDAETGGIVAALAARQALVWLVEITAAQPAAVTPQAAPAGDALPGALSSDAEALGVTTTIRLADRRYITRATDSMGAVLYRPLLTQVELDRQLPLSPDSGSAVGYASGRIRAANPRARAGTGTWDAVVRASDVSGRAVRVLLAPFTFDVNRGLWVDPAYADAFLVWSGVATGWDVVDDELEVTVRDALRPLERPMQLVRYAGSGGYEGGSASIGRWKPRIRGGTASSPVANVPFEPLDTVNLIYQAGDGPGSVVQLYDRAAPYSASLAGTASDLTATTVSAGTYKVDAARLAVRLGTAPIGPLTADVVGYLPDSTAASLPGALAKGMLMQDGGLSASQINSSSFDALDTSAPRVTGLRLEDGEAGVAALGRVLRGASAVLGCDRQGRATAFRHRLPAGTPAVRWTTRNLLPGTGPRRRDTVWPPSWRRTVQYQRNHLVMQADVASASRDRQQFLAAEYRSQSWSSAGVLVRWADARDADPVPTALQQASAASACAADDGGYCGAGIEVWDLVLGLEALGRDLDEMVHATWPAGSLAAGRLCLIRGERIDAQRRTVTLTVIVAPS